MKRISIHKKIVIIFIVVFMVATLLIGVVGYIMSKNALDKKGRQILKNSVEQAMMLIQEECGYVEEGKVSERDAQEAVKRQLLGKLNEDGTRDLNHMIDLGKNGYFIIYNSKGDEVLHPILEGQNVWDVTDFRDKNRYIVQEQIHQAREGGGFMTYEWNLPYSDEVDTKLSYSQYFEEWDWVVISTAYKSDFNADANRILITLSIITISMAVIVIYLFNRYVHIITNPIQKVIKGMEAVARKDYYLIEDGASGLEAAALVKGYNQMTQYLDEAEHNIEIQNQKIAYIAYHDDVTGMPNFHRMKQVFSEKLLQEKKGCMVLINIVGLNVVNAIMGYDKGNQLIKSVGEFILDKQDLFFGARTSSNEFALLLESKERECSILQLKQLKKDALNFVKENGYGQMIDFRFAVVMYPDHADNFDELYEKAILVMKLIKDCKITDIMIYRDSMKEEMEKELNLASLLKQAFIENEIIPYYQQKVDYTTGQIIGVEALARWNSKTLGLVSPGEFLPLIHQMNLTNEFNIYMLNKVLEDYHKLTDKFNEDICVSINITPSTFLDPEFFDKVQNAIYVYDILPQKLILEITEDIFISDMEAVQKITESLHGIGVRISLDDFGSGYSSLNYLTRINFDELKIDKTFIDRIVYDDTTFELVGIFCHIAKVCGYEIIAEGVETEEQLDKLKNMDIKIIQGYLFSKPESI